MTMEEYHRIGASLTPKQRGMYFRIGAEVQSSKSTRGRLVDAGYCHEIALGALVAIDWKSLKAARAILTVTKAW